MRAARAPGVRVTPPAPPWAVSPAEVLSRLDTTADGLRGDEALARLARHGRNELASGERWAAGRLLLRQFANPLVLILVAGAVVSAVAGEWADSAVIGSIVVLSSSISAWREFAASRAIDRLREQIAIRVRVLRDGVEVTVPAAEVVPGDVLVLSAGALVAADAIVLTAHDFFISESVFTGESFPVEKRPGELPAARTLGERRNSLFMGTNVRSGSGTAVVVATGARTEYGHIADRLKLRPPETEFNRGLRRFGGLLTRVMLVLTLVVLALNLLVDKPPIESLLFAVALAVGLTPELLPAILTMNLTRSATRMAGAGVLVRRLSAIEDFGSMDVLCADKTGTLTAGVVRLDAAVDERGEPSPRVRRLAFCNAALETGIRNPLDEAIVAACPGERAPTKLDEIPYDFTRKRLSVVIEEGGAPLLITKGAVASVVAVCVDVDAARAAAIDAYVAARGNEGFRVLAVASRAVARRAGYTRDDESGLEFVGFLLFQDPPKPGVDAAIAALRRHGVALKMITGDNRYVARHIGAHVGLSDAILLTGGEIAAMRDEALWHVAERTEIFAEVDPNQKERIILALKKTGHVVGYMGDGVNDAPAMHAADVSVSVESAVDVAKEAADFVLLRPDLEVLLRGVLAGRETFANTLKYVLTTTSANLGNMLSMAAASVVLPFFPLLAGQILLNNFLSDIPAFGLATDTVDDEWLVAPRRWDLAMVRRFMIWFGALSSAFDLLVFAVLLAAFHATPEMFRTGWFVESLLTELAVAMVVRTRRSALHSRPGALLLWSTCVVAAIAVGLPYAPGAAELGFVPLPLPLLATVVGITLLYVVAAELLKRRFFRMEDLPRDPPGARRAKGAAPGIGFTSPAHDHVP